MCKKRREFINNVLEMAKSGAPGTSWALWQMKPWTAVRITLTRPAYAKPLIGLGFAKVSWPDEWDEEEGQHVALEKAAACIWRQIKNGDDQ